VHYQFEQQFRNGQHIHNLGSDIAVAANVLLERYSQSSGVNNTSPSIRRILIIDLDVHQGKKIFIPLIRNSLLSNSLYADIFDMTFRKWQCGHFQ
jgi:hypothetical protein